MKHKNICIISDNYLCSSCGACINICPTQSIRLAETSIGRVYAQVDETCINCGKCTKVCPSLNRPDNINRTCCDSFIGEIKNSYIGHSIDAEIYKNAQSGGAATVILSYLFENSLIDAALVCKMDFGNTPKVNPFICKKKEELYQCQKSCYTQVPLLSSINELCNFKSVAIIGLPCHIEAVCNLMKISKKYTVIKYKIGLICDRSLCNAIQDTLIKVSKTDTPVKINWRDKYLANGDIDYSKAPVKIISISGKQYEVPKDLRIKLKNRFTPPRCRICSNKLNILSDITLGDPWGMSKYDKKNGDSLIICRSEKGHQIIEDIISKRLLTIVSEPTSSDIIEGQHIEERKEQVKLYINAYKLFFLFQWRNKVKTPLLSSPQVKIKLKEQIFAFYHIARFYLDEKKQKDAIIKSIIRRLK